MRVGANHVLCVVCSTARSMRCDVETMIACSGFGQFLCAVGFCFVLDGLSLFYDPVFTSYQPCMHAAFTRIFARQSLPKKIQHELGQASMNECIIA
jgi:hypothetical protein